MPKGSGYKRGSSAYNPIDVHVGERLRTRRTLLGLSQIAVAEAMGFSFQQLQKYERGTNRISASRLYDLSRILDIDIGYFFKDMDQATKKGVTRTAESKQATARSSVYQNRSTAQTRNLEINLSLLQDL